MRKRISFALVIALCTMSLAACGEDTAANTAADTVTENTVTGDGVGTQVENNVASSSEKSSESLVKAYLKDDTHAEFVFYGDGDANITDITGLSISFGDYQAGLNDFGGSDLQCSIWSDSGNGSFSICDEGIANYNIDSDKITIRVDMSNIPDFSFADVTGDCVVHYEIGENGGPGITLGWNDVVNMDGYTATTDPIQNEDPNGNSGEGTNNEEPSQTNNDSAVNALLSQAAGHYMQGDSYGLDHGGSLDLIDNGDGTFTLANIHIYYKEYVVVGQDLNAGQLGTGSWEENEWHGSSVSFGDGNGAKISRDGVVSVTLSIAGGRNTVEINSVYEAISFNTDDGRGFDFIKVN